MVAPRASIPQAATQAWRDIGAVFGALGTQALIAFAISIAIAFVQRFAAGTSTDKEFETGLLLANFAIACAQAFLLTPYLIATHRFIILGETGARYELSPASHRFQLFFLWSIVLSMFYWVPAFVIASATSAKSPPLMVLGGTLLLASAVAALFLTVRLIIMFPAIAVEAAGATWTNALADTKGNFWRILFISMLATLPAFAGLIVLALSGLAISSPITAVFEGVMSALLMTLAVAIASRLYEQLGDRVNRA